MNKWIYAAIFARTLLHASQYQWRILVVVVQFLEVVKMVVTPPTVCVTSALDIMLGEANRGREVPIAAVANVVHRRIDPVLL